MITGELANAVDRLWSTFWSNGISSPLVILEQVTQLLFLKQLEERGHHFEPGQERCRWSSLARLEAPEELLRVIRDEAFPVLASLRGELPAPLLIGNAAVLAKVVAQVDQLPTRERDTMGDLYEHMLAKLGTAGTHGQFRTPRHLVELMVALAEPRAEEVICDPACGTAGLLVAALARTRGARLRGFDVDPTMSRLASMNLLLHGIAAPEIRGLDALSSHADLEDESCTLVLANPPFQGSVEPTAISPRLRATADTSKTEVLFLARILRLLKAGGRAAVVVPDGLLFHATRAHRALRRELVERHTLRAVLSLPPGAFRPYTGIATAILLFAKGGHTDRVWFFDARADGRTLDDRRLPVAENDLPRILELWRGEEAARSGPRSGGSFVVSVEELRQRGYILGFNAYRAPEPPPPVADAEIQRLKARLRELQREIDEAAARVEELTR